MLSPTSNIPRRHYIELQPLATSHDSVNSYEGRASSVLSRVTLTNMYALPSPGVVAARAYFSENSPPIGQHCNALQWRGSLIEAQEFPARHSALPSPGGLTTKMASFNISFPEQNLEVVRETTESEPNVRMDGSEDVSPTDVKQNDLVKATAVATVRQIDEVSVPVAEVLQQVPFQYTHDRLRDWGHAYLWDMATADAFVTAVSLRRPSLQLVKAEGAEDRLEKTGIVTVRARIHPRAKERKPSVIQRKSDIRNSG